MFITLLCFTFPGFLSILSPWERGCSVGVNKKGFFQELFFYQSLFSALFCRFEKNSKDLR